MNWLAAPAEAEAARLGIRNRDRNAFAHAYTAARMVHGIQEMPMYRGRPAEASDLVDFLGRQKENLPGIFGQQTDFGDYYRDLWNNGIGIDIGNYARRQLYSRDELGRLVKDALDDGTIISSTTDPRIPTQPSGSYLSWPVPSPPQYQGPSRSHDLPVSTVAGQVGGNNAASVFSAGASPIPFLPQLSPTTSGGLLGMMAEAGLVDPSDPGSPPLGGLGGLIRKYLRDGTLHGN